MTHFLLLLAFLSPADEEILLTHDFASYRPPVFASGRHVRARVSTSATDDEAGQPILVCDSADGVRRTVWLLPDKDEAGGSDVVEGRLRVIVQPSWKLPDGTLVPGFTEYRIVEARRVRE